jgi:benzoyl-CoA reductase subunit D
VKLLVSLGRPPVVLITGGLAADAGLVAALRESVAGQGLGIDVRQHEHSLCAGAIGAALWGGFRARKLDRLRDQRAS